MQSSLGFHTIALSLSLPEYDTWQLIIDFGKYNEKTKTMKIYRKNQDGTYITYHPGKSQIFSLPTDIVIYYSNENYNGIEWHIRFSDYRYGFSIYIVEAIINPKFLARIHDYLTAATYSDMNIAITNFNAETQKISPLLKSFADYTIKRIDYCVNIHLDEIIPGCDPMLIMNLIKRGNIPPCYKEWTQYNDKAHRKISLPSSFYLISQSVNINCYSKYAQLQERSRENVKKGYSPIPQSVLDDARNIIRFEVQCKYHKTYALSDKAEKSGHNGCNKYKSLLSPINCIQIVSNYYKRVIGKGDWFTLQEAICIIKSHHFNMQHEKRLVDALQFVNQCRSIAKAKALCEGKDLDSLKQTLNELSGLNINPVTIPKDWNIKHIPNLLSVYFIKHFESYSSSDTLGIDETVPFGYWEYVKKFNCPPI